MSGSLGLRRSTAATAALMVAGWGAFALPAAASPSHGNAASQGSANSAASANHANGAKDEGAKGHKANHGKGPKADNGHGPKGNNGKGPKGNNGKGPKGNNGNHGTAADGEADKGPQASASAGDSKGGSNAGGAGDPAGNNGTVKITPHLEEDGIPQNTPHVSCIFDIEWYGFDKGDDIVSTVEFAMQAPTTDVALSGTDPSQVFVGGDPASGAGTDTGFDGEETYTLAFDGEPHPQQGYHVKLTVHTPGSQGADTKHKVFWVQPCEDEAVVPEAAAADNGTQAPGEGEESSDEAGVMGATGTSDEVTTESDADNAESNADSSETAETAEAGAMGTSAGAAGSSETDVPNSVDAGGPGARVADLVTSPWALLVMALGLALGGAALVARRRTV